MFEQTSTLTTEATKFIKGENKPVIIFEFSYQNLTFIFLGLIITLVLSAVITNAIVNK